MVSEDDEVIGLYPKYELSPEELPKVLRAMHDETHRLDTDMAPLFLYHPEEAVFQRFVRRFRDRLEYANGDYSRLLTLTEQNAQNSQKQKEADAVRRAKEDAKKKLGG